MTYEEFNKEFHSKMEATYLSRARAESWTNEEWAAYIVQNMHHLSYPAIRYIAAAKNGNNRTHGWSREVIMEANRIFEETESGIEKVLLG